MLLMNKTFIEKPIHMEMIESHRQSIMLCLAICAYDGLISEAEINTLFDIYSKKIGLTRDQLEAIIDEFFETDSTLEDFFEAAKPISDTLDIAKKAASADGLDLLENIALQKCKELSKR